MPETKITKGDVFVKVMFVTLLVLCMLLPVAALATPAQEGGVYQLANADDLLWFAEHVNNGQTNADAALTADIDLSGRTWTPIGSDSSPYGGTFDGADHIIQNLKGDNGLFAASSGTVKNVLLMGVDIDGEGNLGAVVGKNTGTVENCRTSGTVDGRNWSIGGIVGWNTANGTIRGCVSDCTTGGITAGGLVGSNYNGGTMQDCLYYGSNSAIEGDLYHGKNTSSNVFMKNSDGTYTRYNDNSLATSNEVAKAMQTYSNYSTEIVTITFHANDGSTAPATKTQWIKKNAPTALTANPFTREGFVFAGWADTASGAKQYDDQQMVSLSANKTLYAVWQQAVVSVINGAKETPYASLDTAVTAANAGDTVKLLANVTAAASISLDKSITLDLNGKTLSMGDYIITVNDQKELTLCDDSGVGKITSEAFQQIIINKGILTIKAGTVENINVNAIQNQGLMTVEGGTVSGGIYNEKSLNVTGGTFTGMYNCIQNAAGMITISNGYFSGNIANDGNSAGESGTVAITGGLFSHDVSAYVPTGYACMANTDTTYPYKVTKIATVTFKVVNGTWADNTTDDKTETVALTAGVGTLAAEKVPSGMIAGSGYEGGSWDVTPNTNANGITGDVTYTFAFSEKAPVTTYTVAVSGGTGSGNYQAGDSVTIVASAAPNHQQFKTWQITPAVNVTSGSTATATAIFTMPVGNVSVIAVYERIPTALSITQQPADQQVAEGQTATFFIGAVGDQLTYQWEINRNDGQGWAVVDGDGTKATYTTAVTKLVNNGFQYRCTVTDQHHNTVTSQIATLHVSTVPDIPQTGDNSRPMLWLTMALLSAIGAVMLGRKGSRA